MSKDKEEKLGDDDYVTWRRVMGIYRTISAVEDRVIALEKDKDNWKIYLEGFVEGFKAKHDKKEKK